MQNSGDRLKGFSSRIKEALHRLSRGKTGQGDAGGSRGLGRREFLKIAGLGAGTATLSTVGASRLLERGGGPGGLATGSAVDPSSADIVVDPSGGDTLKGGLSSASSGDTIVLREGVDTAGDIRLSTGGVTVAVAPGESYRLRGDFNQEDLIHVASGDNVTLDGTGGDFVVEESSNFGLKVNRADSFTLRGLEVRYNRNSGIHLGEGAQNGQIKNCHSWGNFGGLGGSDQGGSADGISAVAGTSDPRDMWPSGNTITGCVLHHNSDDGFDTIRGINNTIERSVVYRNGYTASRFSKESRAPGAGIKLSYGGDYYAKSGQSAPDANEALNNIVYSNGDLGVKVGKGNSHLIEGNTLWNNFRKESSDHDIGFWGSDGVESALIKSNLATSINTAPGAQLDSNVQSPVSGWSADTSTDSSGRPTDLTQFARPSARSEAESRGAGAVSAGGTFRGSSRTLSDVFAAAGVGTGDDAGGGGGRSAYDPPGKSKGPGDTPDISSLVTSTGAIFGNKAMGYVSGGSKTFYVTGGLEDLQVESGATVRIDGEEVPPDELERFIDRNC